MTDIQFDTENEFARPAAQSAGPKGLTKLVMKWGLAKDEKTAQYVLLGIAIVAILITLWLLFGQGGGSSAPVIPPGVTALPPG